MIVKPLEKDAVKAKRHEGAKTSQKRQPKALPWMPENDLDKKIIEAVKAIQPAANSQIIRELRNKGISISPGNLLLGIKTLVSRGILAEMRKGRDEVFHRGEWSQGRGTGSRPGCGGWNAD